MNANKAVIVTVNGVVEVAAEAPKCRIEMEGAPTFHGLAGPMYGGPGVVRYEDAEMCRLLSM